MHYYKDNPIIIRNFTDFHHCAITKTVSLNEEIDGTAYCFRYTSVKNTLDPLKFSNGVSNGQLIYVVCNEEQYVFNRKIPASRVMFLIWIDGYWLPYVHIWAYPKYPDDFNLM